MILPDHTYLEQKKFYQTILDFRADDENKLQLLIAMIKLYRQYYPFVGYIYQIKHKNTNEKYIGQSSNSKRLWYYKNAISKNAYTNLPKKLDLEIKAHGYSNIEFSILTISHDTLYSIEKLEQDMISVEDNLYNKHIRSNLPQTPGTKVDILKSLSNTATIPYINNLPDFNPCWITTKSLCKKGYGDTHICGFRRLHRYSAIAFKRVELNNPEWQPGELHVDHLCKNKACCNPTHLEFVYNSENSCRRRKATTDPKRWELKRIVDRVTCKNQKYIGVTKSRHRFTVDINLGGVRRYLGTYDTRLEAAIVRDQYMIDNGYWSVEFNNNNGSSCLLNRYLFPEDFKKCTTF